MQPRKSGGRQPHVVLRTGLLGDPINGIIKIDKYETVLEKGKIVYYAVAGKKKYRMLDYYKSFYNNDHLAIRLRTMTRPEVFGISETDSEHYIPLRTTKDTAAPIKPRGKK